MPITQGLPSACGCSCYHFFKKHRLGARDILDGLTRHRFGKKADEVTRMTRPQGETDLAIGLKAANTGTMPSAGINDNEGPSHWINLDPKGRHNPHQGIIDRSIKQATIDDEFGFVVKDMRNCFGLVLAILIAALPHHIQKQHASLHSIDEVLHRRTERTKRRRDLIRRDRRRYGWLLRHYRYPSLHVVIGLTTVSLEKAIFL